MSLALAWPARTASLPLGGMLAFAMGVMSLIAVWFAVSDPWKLRHTLGGIERFGFFARRCFPVSSDRIFIRLSVALSCAAPASVGGRPYTGGQCHRTVALLGVAIGYSAYSILHGGRGPAGGLPTMFAVALLTSVVSTGLVFYVLLLHLGRSHVLPCLEGCSENLPPGQAGETSRHRRVPFADGAPIALDSVGEDGEAPDRATAAALARSADTDRSAGVRTPENGAQDGGFHHIGVAAPPARAAADKPTQLLDRLPEALGDDVVYVHVSGHYLDVLTTAGSAVLLMRIADAVAELGDRGMRVHRSYWVAYAHAIRLRRCDHRMLLCLTGDHEVPVSRSYLPRVREYIAMRSV